MLCEPLSPLASRSVAGQECKFVGGRHMVCYEYVGFHAAWALLHCGPCPLAQDGFRFARGPTASASNALHLSRHVSGHCRDGKHPRSSCRLAFGEPAKLPACLLRNSVGMVDSASAQANDSTDAGTAGGQAPSSSKFCIVAELPTSRCTLRRQVATAGTLLMRTTSQCCTWRY